MAEKGLYDGVDITQCEMSKDLCDFVIKECKEKIDHQSGNNMFLAKYLRNELCKLDPGEWTCLISKQFSVAYNESDRRLVFQVGGFSVLVWRLKTLATPAAPTGSKRKRKN